MKVLCSACEAAEARLLCCADEAALCARCDRDVHAANRLAGKHHRLPLLAPDAVAPNCDICQDRHAYFFCLQDRALLCRTCDDAVHGANAFVAAHRRFLLTGVRVGLHPQQPQPEVLLPESTAVVPLQHQLQPPAPAPNGSSNKDKDSSSPAPLDQDIDWAHLVVGAPEEPVLVTTTPAYSSKRTAVTGDWPLQDDFFHGFDAGLIGFTTDNGTSKADSGKLTTDASPNARSSSDSELRHQWSVPELPSPPTASGLHWQGGPRHDTTAAMSMSVPDISSLPENPFLRCFAADTGHTQPASPAKRRRC